MLLAMLLRVLAAVLRIGRPVMLVFSNQTLTDEDLDFATQTGNVPA
jgi:hypothetical protein